MDVLGFSQRHLSSEDGDKHGKPFTKLPNESVLCGVVTKGQP